MADQLCRFCGTDLQHTFCDIGMSPLSNAFLKADQLQKMEPYFPLHVQVCATCYLVQLQEFESPKHIFNEEYAYFSSYSETWLNHAKNYTETMMSRFGLNKSSQVIEIASNDGYLLQYFDAHGIPVLGIEPAANVALVAENKGISTWVDFFGVKTAEKIVSKGKKADLLLGNNVVAHVPDINDFVAGMKIGLKPSGIITMEFPHLLQLIKNNQFDTIYHEHFSYFSLISVEKVFAANKLRIFDVEEIATHGGSLRIFAKHDNDNSKPIEESVWELKNTEIEAGLNIIETYESFSKKVVSAKCELLSFMVDAKQQGKKVAGYGAPAKGNTLLNYCGIGKDFISFTVDRNPHKQGKFLPGTHIPIFSPDRIFEEKPDYVLILPWNIKGEIVEQMKNIRDWNGKFVVPIPEVAIL